VVVQVPVVPLALPVETEDQLVLVVVKVPGPPTPLPSAGSAHVVSQYQVAALAFGVIEKTAPIKTVTMRFIFFIVVSPL
jgi:hypothetical protein